VEKEAIASKTSGVWGAGNVSRCEDAGAGVHLAAGDGVEVES
jgi:hypothetical protein